ncbi:MAG: acetylxylan esterase [Elusimicrobia bacterium]|nr:acetylxylan esterase [Elusimicrobiota bacterium]
MRKKVILIFLSVATLFVFAVCGAEEKREEIPVSFASEDGWQIKGKYLNPVQGNYVLVYIHSQKKNSSEWNKALWLAKKYGYGYLAFDLRGHGESIVSPSGSSVTYRSFNIAGQDNEYNKMIRDMEGAISFLNSQSISNDRLVLIGSVLGANLAIKSAAIHKDIPMLITVTPVLNVNDVLSVNPLRAYGERPMLLISASNRARQYMEFQILNDMAKSYSGRRNVAVIVGATGFGVSILTGQILRRMFAWIKNPAMPQEVERSTQTAAPTPPYGGGQAETETQGIPEIPYEEDE